MMRRLIASSSSARSRMDISRYPGNGTKGAAINGGRDGRGGVTVMIGIGQWWSVVTWLMCSRQRIGIGARHAGECGLR